ncbi:hypothetical protein PIB30_076608 [Stylosanthes scabra]|uniref:Uncharacterized protein n=1 Tax=Stylosanthes scabra TaxID=79078 RepID=A0ABU6RR23_9FABA|nr:hypothetical protein [Stylosanthes scabra]
MKPASLPSADKQRSRKKKMEAREARKEREREERRMMPASLEVAGAVLVLSSPARKKGVATGAVGLSYCERERKEWWLHKRTVVEGDVGAVVGGVPLLTAGVLYCERLRKEWWLHKRTVVEGDVGAVVGGVPVLTAGVLLLLLRRSYHKLCFNEEEGAETRKFNFN